MLRGAGIGLGIAAVLAAVLADLGSGLALVLAGGSLISLTGSLVIGRRARGRQPSIADETSSWADFRRELARARRHERPLSIARLPGGATGRSAVALTAGPHRRLRRIDLAWSEGADVVILMPESDRAAAERAVGRISGTLGIDPAAARIATFPADGLTTVALVEAVGVGSSGTPAPRPLAAAAPEHHEVSTGHTAHG